jgi:hypothetical protein
MQGKNFTKKVQLGNEDFIWDKSWLFSGIGKGQIRENAG